MPKLMSLSHLLVEHIDICGDVELNSRAASQAVASKSIQGVHPLSVTVGSGENLIWRRALSSPILSMSRLGVIPLARGGQELGKL